MIENVESPWTPDLVVELVFEHPASLRRVQSLVKERLGGGYHVEAVFDEEADNHFFLTVLGQPTEDSCAGEIFILARRLGSELGAAEANPLMVDSLYGAPTLFPMRGLSRLCGGEDKQLEPRGWHHRVVETPFAWRNSRGAGARVAVIDTGSTSHNELGGVFAGDGHLNLVEGGTDARDRFSGGFLAQPGHGTVVASVVASRGGLSDRFDMTRPGGITGVAPEAELIAIRAFKSVINLRQTTIPRAIMHAVEEGADVIVMAMGGPTRVSATEKALRFAVAEGVLVICAAGNCWPAVVFPAAYAQYGLATSVAGVKGNGEPWFHTGRGRANVIAAPAEHVWAGVMNDEEMDPASIKPCQGTTLAASITAGAATLWSNSVGGRAAVQALASSRGMTGQAFFNALLRQGARRPPSWGSRDDLGAGILRISKLFKEVGGRAAIPPSLPMPHVLEPWGTLSSATIASDMSGECDPRIMSEMSGMPDALASELIWNLYRAGARDRALAAMVDQEAEMMTAGDGAGDMPSDIPPASPSEISDDLAATLRTRPFLREWLSLPD